MIGVAGVVSAHLGLALALDKLWPTFLKGSQQMAVFQKSASRGKRIIPSTLVALREQPPDTLSSESILKTPLAGASVALRCVQLSRFLASENAGAMRLFGRGAPARCPGLQIRRFSR
jgi:hypothetical protein